jgi:pSer/pThr/pTyr-binding forkhead associated (FHA) protein
MAESTQPVSRTTTLLDPQRTAASPALKPTSSPSPQVTPGPKNSRRLALFIGNEATSPIRIQVDEALIVGRADSVEGYTPDLDLSPFGARDAGVSRRHAKIVFQDGALHICDLGSVNGTRLNGVKLPPNQLYRLNNGAKLECGNLRMTVYVA